MNQTYTLTPDCTLFYADMLDALKVLPDNCIDSCCTDPPYHLTSIVDRMSSPTAAPVGYGTDGAFRRLSGGFMGKQWDGGDIAFRVETWREVWRVLKPGGHVVAFGATRGYHRMTCAIEDAGFEIRDSLMWIFGTGFPKSHDPALDYETTLCDRVKNADDVGEWRYKDDGSLLVRGEWRHPDAIEWDGHGTALKPAFEPIVLARKPLSEKTVAANVLRWRTGALNIGATRVPTDETITATRNIALGSSASGVYGAATVPGVYEQHEAGRWPANVVHDGSDEVVEAFPIAPGQLGRASAAPRKTGNVYGAAVGARTDVAPRTDKGSAARFFYSAKASRADRAGSKHPTVKPIALMQWLARLVTPPGGVILDPFAGSGTTGAAAALEGFRCVLVEREAEYVADICRRLGPMQSPPLAPE